MLTLLLALTAPAAAAIFQCSANGGVAPLVRGEGLAERVGDLVLTCTGGVAGSTVTVNIAMFLTTNVTSRIVSGSTTEALLAIDDPVPAALYNPVNPNPAQCASASCTYGANTFSQNLFLGDTVASNQIAWLGIPIKAPGDTGYRTLRITNVRGNSSAVPFSDSVPGLIYMYVSMTAAPDSIPVANQPQTVAFVVKGMTTTVSSRSYSQCVAPSGTPPAITFAEPFPSAFWKRITTTWSGDPVTGSEVVADQDYLGMNYLTESGYTSSVVAGIPAAVGAATQGTRFLIKVDNLNNGVSLSFPGTVASSAADGLYALWVSGASADGSGGTVTGAGATGLTGTGGQVTAVYELVGPTTATTPGATGFINDDSFTIPITPSYTPVCGSNVPSPGTATITGSFAPVSTVTVASASAPAARFTAGSAVATAFLSISPETQDFNADGKPDLLWRNRTTGQNQVWFMNGDSYLGLGSVTAVSDLNWKLVASADFNADGKPDLLWRHAVTGENIVWFMNGTGYAGQAWLSTVADINYHIVGVADFNGDGKPDLLWRHYGTGQNVIWYMNATNVAGVGYPPAVAETAWKIVGAADFNADGKPDIVWRHATTGANVVWYMNGAIYAGQAALPSVTDMNWKIAGVADYNSDGKPDLLWHNLTTGQNIQWFLNGVNYSGTGYPPNQSSDWAPLGDYDPVATTTAPVTDFDRDGHPDLLWRHATSGQNLMWFLDGVDYDDQAWLITVADSNWKVAAIADFNGDGNPDLLWRHYGTGQNTIWYMNVASIAGTGNPPAVSDVNWKIVGAADFNGDGKQDILWRHALSGEVLVWYMNGTSYTGQTSITTVADLNYKIGAIADFNGDGKPDLLWRHYGTGQNIVWYMNGATIAGVGYPPSVGDTGWMIAGAEDFNADGQTDIVWRHATTGANAVWYMNGMSYLGYGALPAVTDANWKIAMGGE